MTALSAQQVHDLGSALQAIHDRFSSAYGPGGPSRPAQLYIKQARPYPSHSNP